MDKLESMLTLSAPSSELAPDAASLGLLIAELPVYTKDKR